MDYVDKKFLDINMFIVITQRLNNKLGAKRNDIIFRKKFYLMGTDYER